MQIHAVFTAPGAVQADWLIVPLFEDEAPFGAVAEFDAVLHGVITRLRQAGDVAGKANELTPLLDVSGIASRRVLLAGLGKRDKCDRGTLITAAAAAARQLTVKQLQRLA